MPHLPINITKLLTISRLCTADLSQEHSIHRWQCAYGLFWRSITKTRTAKNTFRDKQSKTATSPPDWRNPHYEEFANFNTDLHTVLAEFAAIYRSGKAADVPSEVAKSYQALGRADPWVRL